MRRYELMLLLRPDLEDDKLQSAVEKVTRAIVNAGGSLSKVSPWGKRRLAYDIQHHREASYFLIHFDIQPNEIRELERGMLISEEILRHLVTVLEDRPDLSDEEMEAAVAGETSPADAETPDTSASDVDAAAATPRRAARKNAASADGEPADEEGEPGMGAEKPEPGVGAEEPAEGAGGGDEPVTSAADA
jgi:small subunit ribosomal protein S6